MFSPYFNAESSQDGTGPTSLGSSLGLFPPNLMASDEFPPNDDDQNSVFPAKSETLGRRRGNSVNFSNKEDNIAFSPFESVKALHIRITNRA